MDPYYLYLSSLYTHDIINLVFAKAIIPKYKYLIFCEKILLYFFTILRQSKQAVECRAQFSRFFKEIHYIYYYFLMPK